MIVWMALAPALIAPGLSGHAQAGPYKGLDILFIVDQSGSMGGQPFGATTVRQPSDPLGLRFEAVQYALATLGDYRLSFASDLAMNMAVLNFGDRAVLAMDWTAIAATPTPAQWERLRATLIDQLSADAFRAANQPANLGNTDFIGAFEVAVRQFERAPADPAGKHLRVIVLLTDGQPCVTLGPRRFRCGSKADEQKHMEDLYALTSAAFPPPDYLIYAIALDAQGTIWQERQRDWERIVGEPSRAARAETFEQIGGQFLRILTEVMARLRGSSATRAIPLQPGVNSIIVPPYQKQARLSLFKSSTTPGQLSIAQPDGTPLAPGDARLSIANADRTIETWTILDPAPGEWTITIQTPGGRLEVFFELIPIEVTAQATSQTVEQFSEVPLLVRLTDSAGNALPAYPPPYELTVTATLTLPDAATQSIALTRQPSGAYSGSALALLGGVYSVSVTAATQFPPGTPYVLIRADQVATFRVNPFRFTAGPLPKGEYLAGQSVALSAQVFDGQGNPTTRDTVRVTARLERIDAARQTPRESAAIPAIPLTASGGSYAATLNLDSAGSYRLRLTAELTAPNGQSYTLGEATSEVFTVIASEPIYLVAAAAADAPASHLATEGLPPFAPIPYVAVFEARLASDDRLVDVTRLAGRADIWRIDLARRDGVPADANAASRPVIQPVIEPGEQPGQYRLVIAHLPPGQYAIQVQAQATLPDRYLFDPQRSALAFVVESRFNPMIYLFWGGIGAAALAAALLVALGVRRRVQRRRHPATGKLTILRRVGFAAPHDSIWERDLKRYNSNTIRFGRGQLPRETGFSSLVALCDSDDMARSGQIRVIVQRGRKVVLNTTLTSGIAQDVFDQEAWFGAAPGGPEGGLGDSVEKPTYALRYEVGGGGDQFYQFYSNF